MKPITGVKLLELPYVREALQIANDNPKMTFIEVARKALGPKLPNLSRRFYLDKMLELGDIVRRLRNNHGH